MEQSGGEALWRAGIAAVLICHVDLKFQSDRYHAHQRTRGVRSLNNPKERRFKARNFAVTSGGVQEMFGEYPLIFN